MHRRRQIAYSLYELLMTIALAALVLGVGAPSLGKLVADHRIRAQIDALFHAAHLARKESIMRHTPVTLCASADGARCLDQTDWSAGWLMFVNLDHDRPAQHDAGEPVLWRHGGDDRVRIVANRRSFTWRATQLRATNGTLVFCDRAGRTAARALVVSYTGRPRVARRKRSGQAYICQD